MWLDSVDNEKVTHIRSVILLTKHRTIHQDLTSTSRQQGSASQSAVPPAARHGTTLCRALADARPD